MRRRWFVLALVLTISLLSSSALAASTGPATLPATAGIPESVTVEPGTDTFFASSFTTGAVFRGRSVQLAQQFLAGAPTGRGSAAGVKFDGPSRLMVISGPSPSQLTQLQVFSSHSGRHQATFTAPARDDANLNDMAVSVDGDVYITTSRHRRSTVSRLRS
jgi:sugar lactone lactonase YvrE